MPRDSVHAKCLAVRREDDRTLICRKSEGHTRSTDPRFRTHFDPDADQRWTDKEETDG